MTGRGLGSGLPSRARSAGWRVAEGARSLEGSRQGHAFLLTWGFPAAENSPAGVFPQSFLSCAKAPTSNEDGVGGLKPHTGGRRGESVYAIITSFY